MTVLDYSALGVYILFILWAASCFRRFASDSRQFINGGASMQWWMAGATAFMTQFSAWTFTGAAGKAFTDGFPILILFWGNALGFLVAGRFFAARYRKLRVETAMQVLHLRFGQPTERLFTWLQFPLSTITAAVWLNGLAWIISAMTGFGMVPTLLVTGAVITLISASGGAWTVNATNVIQLVLILAITLVTGLWALWQGGGPTNIVQHFPVDFWQGSGLHGPHVLLCWVAMVLLQQTLSTNNAITCYRFLVTRNEDEARKAAWLAGILFLIGPVFWFIPPWVAASQGTDLQALYPHLGHGALNAAYLSFVERAMPAGTLGLTLAAMLAATISPMSSALNRNAGIFLRNVYQRPQHSDRHLLQVGKLFTLGNGLLATLVGWWMACQENLGFFELVMMIGSMLILPMSIPALLAIVVRRAPDWAGWSTLLVGGLLSLSLHTLLTPLRLADWLQRPLSAREVSDLTFAITVAAQGVITGGWLLLTRLWYRPPQQTLRIAQIGQLFANLQRPLAADEIAEVNPAQPRLLGALLLSLGLLLTPLLLWDHSLAGRGLHAAIALSVATAGVGLRLLASQADPQGSWRTWMRGYRPRLPGVCRLKKHRTQNFKNDITKN